MRNYKNKLEIGICTLYKDEYLAFVEALRPGLLRPL